MKKILAVSLLAIFVILGMLSFKQVAKPVFYYTFSTKKMLKIHPGKVVVRYRENISRQAALSQLKQVAGGFREEWVDDRTVIMDLSDKNGAAGLAEVLGKQPDVVATHPVYIVDEKDELGLTDEFIVQFREGVRPAYIDSLNKAYRVSV
ncbi:hypothetical protein [Chitinophaga varians]|uniref:hypothetical protein n=1 Tax=Chitinophaga varians TaxID=2202339 RepID=UPI00165F2E1F|nr:hypothetical protein [Chitinophaga varians]MBC9914342.1 hypothetical protein [Chitinophaga varians]